MKCEECADGRCWACLGGACECLHPSSPCKYAVECGQECPKPREDGDPDPYVCTLADCHEGPHVAEDLYGNICAAWNGTDCLIRPASPQAETLKGGR
jgi:hypothetical protein